MVPSLDTRLLFEEANGLVALITCGSLDTLVVAWSIWLVSPVSVPCLAWNTIWPP